MGELYCKLEIENNHSKVKINAFLDIGSTYNVIGYELSDGTPVLGLEFESVKIIWNIISFLFLFSLVVGSISLVCRLFYRFPCFAAFFVAKSSMTCL